MVMNDMADDGKWGAEIAVDGVRPDWLKQSDMINIKTHSGWVAEHNGVFDKVSAPISDWAWMHSDGKTPNILAIRLPANHPHYIAPTPDERVMAPELVSRLVAVVKRMVREPSHLDGPIFKEAREIVAALEPVVDEDLVEARNICADLADKQFHDAGLAYEYRAGDLDDQLEVKSAFAALRRRASRDVTPCTREQFEEDCRS